jgi:hypothetical protein
MREPRRPLWKSALFVIGGALGVVLALPNISTAAEKLQSVFIANDAANPVPVRAQGTTPVSGTVDVRTTPDDRTPYQKTIFFNQTSDTCTQFVCSVAFPTVPAGQRLVVTYASARYALSSNGLAPSVRVTANGLDESILLPAPERIGFDSYIASGPVTLFVEAGRHPGIDLGGQFVLPVSNTAEVSITGYLVPST